MQESVLPALKRIMYNFILVYRFFVTEILNKDNMIQRAYAICIFTKQGSDNLDIHSKYLFESSIRIPHVPNIPTQ